MFSDPDKVYRSPIMALTFSNFGSNNFTFTVNNKISKWTELKGAIQIEKYYLYLIFIFFSKIFNLIAMKSWKKISLGDSEAVFFWQMPFLFKNPNWN